VLFKFQLSEGSLIFLFMMKSFNYSVITLLLICMAFPALSQVKKGDKRFGRLSYAEAIKPYQKYLEKNPTDGYAISQLAECYRRINDFENAELWFAKAVEYDNTDPVTYLHYGQVLMNNQKWEEAQPWFDKYLERKPGDVIGSRMAESATSYKELMEDSSRYQVQITNINTEAADFSPNIYKDKVIFASARRQGEIQFGWTSNPFLELFEAAYDGKPELGEPRPMAGRVNSKLHEAHVTFSPDGETMFFSRNNIINRKVGKSDEGVILLKTYRSDLINGKWKNLEDIPFNNDEYSVGHPALTADGNTLFFVSDMPGGIGGTDIYKVTLDIENRNWDTPVNLGPEINTPGNEMFPWVDKDGTLYYASNGKVGMGGLDLFKASGMGAESAKIVNMGYPINSSRDDFALVFDQEQGVGFFSSNRSGGVGGDDIYSFLKKRIFKGIVIDAVTGARIENARVEVYGSGELEGMGRTDDAGQFLQGLTEGRTYFAVASKQGYDEERIEFDPESLNFEDEIVMEIPLRRSDECPDPKYFVGTLVDEEGNPLPRREVKVIETEMVVETDENGNILTSLDPNKQYDFVYDGPEVKKPIRQSVDMTALANTDTARSKIVVPDPSAGDVFFIIYYDFDKFNIRKWDARPELNRVVKFMQDNPQVVVQLASHTDCRGTDAYNQNLSKNRAKEAYTYIVNSGISNDRLTFVWKGERELTNECADEVNCTEEEHQLNRRTEFKLMGEIQKYPDPK